MTIETFSERLRSLQAGNNWTVQDLADKTGISKRTLDKYLLKTGASQPGIDVVVKIAEALGVSLDWIVLGREIASTDLGRMTRLTAMAASQKAFEHILDNHKKGEKDTFIGDTIMGLTPIEWAAEVGWDAGERAHTLAKQGTNRADMETAERAMKARLEKAAASRAEIG